MTGNRTALFSSGYPEQTCRFGPSERCYQTNLDGRAGALKALCLNATANLELRLALRRLWDVAKRCKLATRAKHFANKGPNCIIINCLIFPGKPPKRKSKTVYHLPYHINTSNFAYPIPSIAFQIAPFQTEQPSVSVIWSRSAATSYIKIAYH